MTQRKKKQTPQNKQKILTAQNKKEFFRKFKTFLDNVCGDDIYPLVPQNLLERLYPSRCSPFRFKKDENNNVSDTFYVSTKIFLNALIRQTIKIESPRGIAISLNDAYTLFFSGLFLLTYMDGKTFPQSEKVKDALQIFNTESETLKKSYDQLYELMLIYSWMESDISKKLYWLEHDLKVPDELPGISENIITIHAESPLILHFDVDGISRPAIKFGWTFPFSGMTFTTISSEDLNIPDFNREEPLDIYIQSHAAKRLNERIDCFIPGIAQFNLYNSLDNPIVIHYNNKILLEYRIFEQKAGYLVAVIQDGVLLIRTFLFLTQSGTPEGDELGKQTGLNKIDKRYLQIDKISTFMNSDLDNNIEAQEVLKTSGCQCLLDLYNSKQSLIRDKEEQESYHFDNMMDYLKSNKVNTRIHERNGYIGA